MVLLPALEVPWLQSFSNWERVTAARPHSCSLP